MSGVNKVILVGRLGKDPEVRNTSSGKAVCSISLATSNKYKNSSGEQQEKTEWHKIVVWGKLAEICGEYLTKGSQIYIEGSLQTRGWDKDGETRYTTEVVGTTMQMLDSRKSNSSVGNHNSLPNDDVPF